MNDDMIEELMRKAMDLRCNNDFIKDIYNNKEYLLKLETKKILTLLAKNMFMKFNDQFLNTIIIFLCYTEEQEKFILNWLQDEYQPFLNMVLNNLNVATHEKLIDLSVILDNQIFYLKKSSEGNLSDFKLAIYEVPDELKKKLRSSELLLTEKQVEQHTVNKIIIGIWENVATTNTVKRRNWYTETQDDTIKEREENYNRLDWKGAVLWEKKDGMKRLIY